MPGGLETGTALNIRKGEEFLWIIEDKNTLILKRKKTRKPRTAPKLKT